MTKYTELLKPFKIGKLNIKNRMCMGAATLAQVGPNGEMTAEGANYFIERARGGFGLITQQAVWADMAVEKNIGLLCPWNNPALFTRSVAKMIDRIHRYGCKLFCQVTMGIGRNVIGCAAPSELPYYFDPSKTARELTVEEIQQKIQWVIKTAKFLKGCGYDGIEVHAMHWGYLIDEFAMSITNHRNDQYGGSLENRIRVCKEIVEGIKAECGADFPVTSKMGMKSYIKGLYQPTWDGEGEAGRTLEEAIEIAKLLESYGYDALTVNSGIYDSFYRALPPSYVPREDVLKLSAELKKHVNIPVMAIGRLNDPDLSERAIAEGMTDAVVYSRAAMADPEFPKKVMMGEPELIRPCLSCNMGCFLNGCCAVNPQAARELTYGLTKAMNPKKIMVVGGGAAGMEFARTATLRGHKVSLYEREDTLGGNLIPAGTHSFKAEIKALNHWYQGELAHLGVDVHTGCAVTAELVREIRPDAVVLAVGAKPVMPRSIPGIDSAKSVCCTDAILGKAPVGETVVVVGGGLTGCELAVDLAGHGKRVTVVEMSGKILSSGPATPPQNVMALNLLMEKYGVTVLTGTKLDAINDSGALVTGSDGESRCLEADTVVMSVGLRPEPSMASKLYGEGIEVYEIGDGRSVANIHSAVWDAYEVARSI